MLTQCPNCQTTFRVTSEILRVAHGQVRCGRCHTQFDALERLIEEGAAGNVESGRYLQPSQPASTQIEVDEPETQEDITLEGRHIEITGTYRVMDDVMGGPGQPQIRREVTEEWVEIEDVDDEAFPDDSGIEVSEAVDDSDAHPESLHQPQSGLPAEPPYASLRETTSDDDEQDRFARKLTISATRRPTVEVAEVEPEVEPELELTPQRQRTPGALLWKLLAAPLVLVLIGQVVHHYRAELARHPRVGTPLMNIYNSLRIPLTPDWNLHAYEIKQWGVLSDPENPGTLKVRASVTNRAAFSQPYPLLRLVLEDRWGDQVRAREFEPADYLDPAISADRLLAPQQPMNATIAIVDPGPDAEGFRFDVCLRGPAGPVCAADVPE